MQYIYMHPTFPDSISYQPGLSLGFALKWMTVHTYPDCRLIYEQVSGNAERGVRYENVRKSG